jgi:hypothetical protein
MFGFLVLLAAVSGLVVDGVRAKKRSVSPRSLRLRFPIAWEDAQPSSQPPLQGPIAFTGSAVPTVPYYTVKAQQHEAVVYMAITNNGERAFFGATVVEVQHVSSHCQCRGLSNGQAGTSSGGNWRELRHKF